MGFSLKGIASGLSGALGSVASGVGALGRGLGTIGQAFITGIGGRPASSYVSTTYSKVTPASPGRSVLPAPSVLNPAYTPQSQGVLEKLGVGLGGALAGGLQAYIAAQPTPIMTAGGARPSSSQRYSGMGQQLEALLAAGTYQLPAGNVYGTESLYAEAGMAPAGGMGMSVLPTIFRGAGGALSRVPWAQVGLGALGGLLGTQLGEAVLPGGAAAPSGGEMQGPMLPGQYMPSAYRLPRTFSFIHPTPSGGTRVVSYRNMGTPILWSGDLAAVKRVRRVAGRARRRVGGR